MINLRLGKALAVAVIILFLGLAIQPSVAVQPETEIDIEPKDYLFQTIIDIANNPELKELLEQHKCDLFKLNVDRSVYCKLFLRYPRLFGSLLFSKSSLTYEYLDRTYSNGIEITKIIGEDKALELIESIKVSDTEIFNEFNNIIANDEELSGRIAPLRELNKELKPDSPLQDWPLICYILGSIILSVVFLYELSETTSIIGIIVWLITIPFMPFIAMFGLVIYSIGVTEGCWDWPE